MVFDGKFLEQRLLHLATDRLRLRPHDLATLQRELKSPYTKLADSWLVRLTRVQLQANTLAAAIGDPTAYDASLIELIDEWADKQPECNIAPLPPRAAFMAKPVQAGPVVAASASGGDEWKAKARARAVEIIERQRKRDLYPPQIDVADEIAREFRADGVMGASGKPLTGSYIKRHALTGISSAQGKRVSTSIRRGK